MAVLEEIRKRGGIIVSVVIGIALLAFIIGDFLPGRGNRNLDIAEIGGKTLEVQEYENKITEMTNMYQQNMQQTNLDEQTIDMIREQAWQMLVSETVMNQEYEHIGLTVSPEELFELIQGANPNPRVRQFYYFINPQTGEFDRSRMIEFLKGKNNDPNTAADWNMFEKSLIQERYSGKFNALLAKGMFVPDFMAENENLEINRKVDFDYVVQRYTTVADSTVKVTTGDLKKYYNAHKKQWEQNAARDIEYVVFNIVPSDDDRAAANAWIEKIKPEFEKAEDPIQFVRLNSKVPSDSRFMTKDQLPVQAAELFDAEVGTMVGPYQEGEALRLVKSVRSENRPDSVNVRRIALMPKQQTQQAFDAVKVQADSIKKAIEGGADFSELALKYSADPSVITNNGEFGWIQESGMPVSAMSEMLFNMKRNEVFIMPIDNSPGMLLMQVTDRGKEVKKIQIATLQHDIIPSSRTEQILYSQASKFAMENRTAERFDETAAAQNLNKRMASSLGENDRQIPGLSSARPVVKWAYEAKMGVVSDVFKLENAYVVAILKSIRKKGIAPLEQVASEIDITVRREKKAEQIAASLSEAANNAQSFSDMALSLNLPVETASDITLSAFSIPGAGVEPELIAAATVAPEGKISQPVNGITGVFVLTVKQIAEPEEGTLDQAKERLSTTYANRSMSESMQALRKAADVDDMRSKFY